MPTRKISDRERLTIFARTASDDELEQALEILRVESSVRGKSGKAPKKAATRKPAAVPPGPSNPPKPANDNPQG